jgi:hypothetical protein
MRDAIEFQNFVIGVLHSYLSGESMPKIEERELPQLHALVNNELTRKGVIKEGREIPHYQIESALEEIGYRRTEEAYMPPNQI